MGVVKFLQASDVHDETPDMARFIALRELANTLEVDASLYLGDFFEDEDLVKSIIGKQQEIIGSLPESVRADHNAFQAYQKYGIEQLRQFSSDTKQPENVRSEVAGILSRLENEEGIRESLVAVQEAIAPAIVPLQDSAVLTLDERTASLDDILGGHNAPVLGVRGNHDTDAVYAMSNIHFVETGAVSVGGLLIAAAPNTYEKVSLFPEGMYSQLESDPVDPNEVLKFILENGSEEDAEQYRASVEAGSPILPDCLKTLPVYDRLERQTEGKAPDILLTHKGPHKLATNGDANYGSGTGLEVFVKEFTPSVILSGHIHGAGLFDDEHGYQGLRSSDQRVYVIEVDSESKKIVAIDIYRWADRKIEHRQAA